MCFFFQAEDGIRDVAVTGVQTCALPISVAGTYMELGTDLAQVGKMPEATATCDKILTVEPVTKNKQAGCYKNVAIVLTNNGKLADAIAPLQKATQLNPQEIGRASCRERV